MNGLPERFRDGGFDFRLITRRGPVALLAKSKASLAESYEVVILQHRPKEIVFGTVLPAEKHCRTRNFGAMQVGATSIEKTQKRNWSLSLRKLISPFGR